MDTTLARTSAISLLHRVQHRLSNTPLELIYTPHDRWPIPHPPFTPLVRRPLRVLVLDSSYNPPTLAHLALANSRRPMYTQSHDTIQDNTSDYDAKLLLLSVRNADKSMKPDDASYLQRLEMMAIFAKYVVRNENNGPTNNDGTDVTPQEAANVAVAIIDEPTFIGKSSSLLAFLKSRFTSFESTTPPSLVYDTQLTFMVGYDTLERLLLPKYYASESQMLSSLRTFMSPAPDGDDSRVVCAQRGSSGKDSDMAGNDVARPTIVQEFISSQRIIFIDIGEDLRTYSSTAVREAISRPDSEAVAINWKTYVPSEIAEYIVREKLYTNLK
jgi:nicotinamide-nucleotide adenylyltransferase